MSAFASRMTAFEVERRGADEPQDHHHPAILKG
jgi:hypothetical protein